MDNQVGNGTKATRVRFVAAKVLLLGGGLPIVGTLACDALFPPAARWLQVPLHAVAEALGLFAGGSLAILLWLQQRRRPDASHIRIAAALVGMSILDGLHSAVAPGNAFVWLHSIAALVGGLLFALVWVSIFAPAARAGTALPAAVALAATLVGAISLGNPGALPAMLSQGVFTPTAAMINNLGGVLFVAATAGFLARYREQPRNEEVLFAAFCLLNGSAGLLFRYSQAWDAGWWLWHGLRLIAYLILLGYSFVVFWRTGNELEERSAELATKNRTLQGVLREIAEAVSLLGTTASEILFSTTQVAASMAETSTAIGETTTTVEEVRQAAQLSSQKAKNVADSAQRVSQIGQAGQGAVDEVVAGMEHIRAQMEAIAATIVRLSEQTQSIGGIIAAVTDIADQSNLLAVNAAIEATRAGEQGKAFGVVAQEIKSLAEQSKQATLQVRAILSDVQRATSAAVMATEQGSKSVEAGVRQSAQTGEAITRLAESSQEAVQTAMQIAASSRQQVVGMDQIGLAMENINKAGAQTAASTTQMETAARNLHEMGQKLKRLVELFKG